MPALRTVPRFSDTVLLLTLFDTAAQTIDYSSPLSAFRKLRTGDHGFLWEVSLPHDPTTTEYSVIGIDPFGIIRTGPKHDLRGGTTAMAHAKKKKNTGSKVVTASVCIRL